MKKNKKIYYECPKCKTKYTKTVSNRKVPTKTKKNKDGTEIVLETRRVPFCTNCNTNLVRHTS